MIVIKNVHICVALEMKVFKVDSLEVTSLLSVKKNLDKSLGL